MYWFNKLSVFLDKLNYKIKEEVFCRIDPANSSLFDGLIRQIVPYLPDYKNFRSCKGTYDPVRYWSDKSKVTSQE